MNDSYSELLVKKEPTGKEALIKIALVGGAVLSLVGGMIVTPLLLVLTLILGGAAFFMIPNLDLEYEYIFVNGELDIDRIASKSKRKRMKTFDLKKMEIMAPLKSHRMDYHNNNKNLKVYDFSSGVQDKGHKVYAMIIPGEKENCKVLIEPDEELIKNIEKSCPRKVFND